MQKTSPPELFKPQRLSAIDARARAMAAADADFLHREAAATIMDRLDATNRDFEIAVDLFPFFPAMRDALAASEKIKTTQSVVTETKDISATSGTIATKSRELLPLEENSVHLATSLFGLHRVNDLPGMLTQIRRCLVDDGLLMACLPGERTLSELRSCLMEAESALTGSASLRVDPFVEVRQAGGLLQRAGFALPVVDADVLTVRYGSLQTLVRDLRSMGATAAFTQSQTPFSRELFVLTEKIYREKYSDPDGRIRASVEIIYLSGWKPHASQQQPLKPGSAIKSLKDVL